MLPAVTTTRPSSKTSVLHSLGSWPLPSPLTAEFSPLAVFSKPPLTDDPKLSALFAVPPEIEATGLLALLGEPSSTTEHCFTILSGLHFAPSGLVLHQSGGKILV